MPPPSGLQPAVTATQAFQAAWEQEPPFDKKFTSVHATLAVHGADRTPVWVITYTGVCDVPTGPGGPAGSQPTSGPAPDSCSADKRWHVDVDGTSGKAYSAFAYTYDPTDREQQALEDQSS